ncbi:hypothetical protein NHX12_014426, partial [Muraenolepis orangiensis]
GRYPDQGDILLSSVHWVKTGGDQTTQNQISLGVWEVLTHFQMEIGENQQDDGGRPHLPVCVYPAETTPPKTTPPSVYPAETTPPCVYPAETTPPKTTPPCVYPAETTPPCVYPAETIPPSVYPAETTPPCVYPAETTPPCVYPTETTPPSVYPTETTPPCVYPAETTPPCVYPAETTPPCVYPAETTPPCVFRPHLPVCVYPAETTPPFVYPAETTPPFVDHTSLCVYPAETTPPSVYPAETTPPKTTPPCVYPAETTPPCVYPAETTPPCVELLASSFTETRYTEAGQAVTVSSSPTDHCFYHGDVRGHPDSWVAVSVCSGVRGLISLNSSHTFYLEPIGGQSSVHWLLSAQDPPLGGGTCGHAHETGRPGPLSKLLLRPPQHQRVKRDGWGTTKYMELYIVADNALYTQQNKDYHKTKLRIMEIANYVDKVWTERDQCLVTGEPNTTLGVVFKGTTIGMAPLEGMCSLENSGGINVDHSDLPIGAAATMAHEIGHNFGMSHDHEGCCLEATAQQGGCVMAAATGHPFPRVFSHCSKRDLDSYFQKGGGMCLFNMPDMKDLVGGKRCGNGFVEDGEECDCGEPEECTNDCCNPNNCTLKEEAQCAHGVCCESCKLKQAGSLCRGPAGACDLPEFCTGASPYCPSNVYLLDGSSCQQHAAYCYSGMCLTHLTQCLQLWGK